MQYILVFKQNGCKLAFAFADSCVDVRVTCASCSTDGDQMGSILCDGLDWKLMLPERALLHNGDCCQRSSLRALDDATNSAYR